MAETKEKQLGPDGNELPKEAAPAETPKPEDNSTSAPERYFPELDEDPDLLDQSSVRAAMKQVAGTVDPKQHPITFSDGSTWDPLNWVVDIKKDKLADKKDKAAANAPPKKKSNRFRKSVVLVTLAMLSGIGMCYNNYYSNNKCSWIPDKDKNVKEICYKQESIFGLTSGEERKIFNDYIDKFIEAPIALPELPKNIPSSYEAQDAPKEQPKVKKKSGFFKKLLGLGWDFRSLKAGYVPNEKDKKSLTPNGMFKEEWSLSLDKKNDELCALADSNATDYAAKNKQELRLAAFNKDGKFVENKLDEKGYGCVPLDQKDYELAALATGEKLVIASSPFNDKTHDENVQKMGNVIASEAGMNKEGLEAVLEENKAPYMLDSMIITIAEKGKPFDGVLTAQDLEKDKISIKLMNPEKYKDIGLEINEIPDEVLASNYNKQVALMSKNPVTQDNLEVIVCAADEKHPVGDAAVPNQCTKYDVSMDGSKKVVATKIEEQKVAEVAAEDSLSVPFEPSAEDNLSVPFEPSAEAGSTADQIAAEAVSEMENPYTLSLRSRFQIKHDKTFFELKKSGKQPNDLRRYYLPANFMEERLNGMMVHTDSDAKQLNYTWFTADGGSTTETIALNSKGNAKLRHRDIPKDAVALKLDDLVSKDTLVIGTGLDIPAFNLFLGEEKVPYTSIDENGNVAFNELAPGDYVLRKNPAEKVLHDNYVITAKLNDTKINPEGDSMTFRLTDGDKLKVRVEGHSSVDVDEIYISVGSKQNGNSTSPAPVQAEVSKEKQSEAKKVPAQTESKTPVETKAPAKSNSTVKEETKKPERIKETTSSDNRVKLSGNLGMFNKSSIYENPILKQETNLSGWNTGVEGSYTIKNTEFGASVDYSNASGKIKNITDKRTDKFRTDKFGIGIIANGSLGNQDSLHINPSIFYGRIMSNTKTNLDLNNTTIEQNNSTDRLAGNVKIAYDKFGVDLCGIFDGEKRSIKDPDSDDYGMHRALWAGTFVDINQFMVELYVKNMSRYNYELERDLIGNSAGLYAGFNGKVGVSLAGEFPVSNDNQQYLLNGGISIPVYKNKLFLNINGDYNEMNYDEGASEVKENSYGGSVGISNFNKIKDRIKPFHLENYNLN